MRISILLLFACVLFLITLSEAHGRGKRADKGGNGEVTERKNDAVANKRKHPAGGKGKAKGGKLKKKKTVKKNKKKRKGGKRARRNRLGRRVRQHAGGLLDVVGGIPGLLKRFLGGRSLLGGRSRGFNQIIRLLQARGVDV